MQAKVIHKYAMTAKGRKNKKLRQTEPPENGQKKQDQGPYGRMRMQGLELQMIHTRLSKE